MYKSLKKYMKLKKSLAALLAAALVSLPGLSASAMDPIMPYGEIWGGESATAYTVVDGSGEIQTFQVDIVGKMDGGKGGSRSIMARASGSLIDQTGGVLQGMSGSPIYVDGRLIGALAAGIKDMAPYTFFITPIEDMLPIWSLPDNKNKGKLASFDLKKYQEDKAKKAEEEAKKAENKEAAEETAAVEGEAKTEDEVKADAETKADAEAQAEAGTKEATASEEQSESDAKVAEQAAQEQPAPEAKAEDKSEVKQDSPAKEEQESQPAEAQAEKENKAAIFFSGFDQAGLEFLKKGIDPKGEYNFRSMGLEAGTGLLGTRYNAELYPGSPVGVAVVYGDFSVGATGTVTAVDGKKVLAFGHSFLHKGNVNYFMTDASVVGTISGPSAGMKIANIGSIIGRVNQDRETGVAGLLGEFPTVVPMKVHVEDKTLARQQDYGVRIAYDEDYLPQLTGSVAYAALAKTSDTQAGSTAKVEFTIRTDALPEGKVVRSNMFYSPSDVGQTAFGELVQAMNYICTNKEKESDIVDVQADISVEEGRHTASIVSATPEKQTVKPGETVNFKTTIKPYRGESKTLNIPYTVPKLQPEGTMHLDVRGGGFVPVTTAMLLQQVGIETGDEKEQSVADRLQALTESGRNNEIIIAPGAAAAPPSEKEQKRLIREAAKAAKQQAEEEKNHKVEFLKDKKDTTKTKFETEYIIDNVIHAVLKVERK